MKTLPTQLRLGALRRTFAGSTALTLTLALAVTVSVTRAAERAQYATQVGTSSSIKVDGTSTIHDWTVETKLIKGAMDVGADFLTNPAEGVKDAPKADITIQVSSIKSGKTRMDEVMQEAMKMVQFPTIQYTLKEMALKEAPASAGGPFKVEATGEVTVSGVKRPLKMEVKFEPMTGDKVKISGATPMKMTEFGIKPPAPSLALGLIKTGDDIKVSFEWVAKKKTAKP